MIIDKKNVGKIFNFISVMLMDEIASTMLIVLYDLRMNGKKKSKGK